MGERGPAARAGPRRRPGGRHLGTRWLVENGFKGDYAVICEGGDLRLYTCHKGDYGLEIRTVGKATHAATPEKGVNAVHKMIDVANALLAVPNRFRWEERNHPLAGPPLISISVIEGGIQRNMVPDRCRMVVDRRVVPRFETVEDARREVQTVLSELRAKDEKLSVETAEVIDVEPAEVSETEPIVSAMQTAAEKALGHRLEVAGLKGFTDAHWMVNQHRIPTVSFGTRGGNIHGVDEYVEIDSIISVAKVLAQLAVDLLVA
ncbi:MAG: M20/M25/M40 family metallo-hydrolase [Candidatus Bathyarchaeia archaeon]